MSQEYNREPAKVPNPKPDQRPEAEIDESLEESFPASDPSGWTPLHTGDPKRNQGTSATSEEECL